MARDLSVGAEFLKELKRLADPEDLPALLKRCVGRRVHMPRGLNPGYNEKFWLKEAIGGEKAQELIRRFAEKSWIFGDIDVPMSGNGYYPQSRRDNHMRFVKAVRSGKTNSEIAGEMEISRRAVVMRKKRLREMGVDLSIEPVSETDGAGE